MHEMSIAASVLDIVIEHTAGLLDCRVSRVQLAIGELAGVSPEALTFCFDAVAQGTIAAEAQLSIIVLPLAAHCRLCGHDFAIDRYRFVCPDCGSCEPEIVSGQELRVDQIEVE